MDAGDKRRHERIKLPYVIKYQSVLPDGSGRWNVVNPINMSESGICFLTMEEFTLDEPIQVKLHDPAKTNECQFECKVRRCDKSKARPIFYETAVTIEEMSDAGRTMYLSLIKTFGNQKNG